MAGRISVLALALALVAAATAARPARATPDADRAHALLATLETGTPAERAKAAEELIQLGPRIVGELGPYLARPHKSTPDERRALLILIKAAVPDDQGRFADPGRLEAKQVREDDKFNWLAELLKIDPATLADASPVAPPPPPAPPPPKPGARKPARPPVKAAKPPPPPPAVATKTALGETLADVAALRALASTQVVDAARIIVDTAFQPATLIYRDECGRRLRAMAPYSIPALTIASQSREPARKRYATYQLERLDRQDPAKALSSASGDEDLRIAILDAFRTTKHREAVHAVLATVNDEAPRVRAAARATWLGYVTGKLPPPAPKKKLALPGGKLTDEEMPLWYTYRELADADLRKLGGELFGEEYPEKEKVDLEAMSKRIFAYYDQQRSARDQVQVAEAKAKADAGDLDGAAAIFDRLLAQDPDRPERNQMAAVYFARGQALEKQEKWTEAAAAYSKAHFLDPQGKNANDALAAHHYTLGKALTAAGKDGGASFRRAVALKPSYGEARKAAAAADSGDHPSWLLYLAILLLAGALVVGGLGLAHRQGVSVRDLAARWKR